jgi:AcrR family transcriptional regulator
VKEEIIGRIWQKLVTEGVADFTIDDLSGYAGVSRRTFYKYAIGKDEVLDALMDRILARIQGHFDEHFNAGDEDPLETLRAIFSGLPQLINPHLRAFVFGLRRQRPDLVQKMMSFRRERLRSLETMLVAAQKKKQVRRDVNPRFAIDALIAMAEALLVPEYVVANGGSLDQVFESVFDIFFNGVAEA